MLEGLRKLAMESTGLGVAVDGSELRNGSRAPKVNTSRPIAQAVAQTETLPGRRHES